MIISNDIHLQINKEHSSFSIYACIHENLLSNWEITISTIQFHETRLNKETCFKWFVLVQNDAVLIDLKQNKEGQTTYHLVMLIFFLKKLRKKAGFVATLQSLFLSHLFPKQDKEHTPSHYFVLLPRQNKSSFTSLKAQLQEAKTYTPTSHVCQCTSFVNYKTL